MENKDFEISLEYAKDNNFTCKITKDNKKTYLYSKYYPKKGLCEDLNEKLDENKNYIVLGLGLGYELEELQKRTTGKIYVIDYNKCFYNIIKENEKLSSVISNENTIFLFGDDYKSLNINFEFELYSLEKIIILNSKFFIEVSNFLSKKNIVKKQKNILCFSHVTILDDSAEAFKEAGFEISFADFKTFKTSDNLIPFILKVSPEFIFSINYNTEISLAAQKLNIPYISWTVDTPCYSLYSKDIKNTNDYLFIYDKTIANYLKQLGAKNVFHLPVAANIKRINKSICKNGFISDVSFVGNLTKSKYRQLLMPRLSDKSLFFIDNLIHKQNNQIDDFILKKYLTTDFVLKILKESNVDIENYLFPHLSLKEQMAFYLGHEQSYIERINFAKAFEKNFDDFKVYGNDEWINNIECYNGKAEHFQKMPEVFNRSKINLNLTRTFVESGLPMRVFDIIGSCGFLLSNYKEELTECFEDKKDIAIFHSLEEAIELSKYYLKNDDLRFKMIENAYSKLEKLHTFKNRIEYILKEVLN